MGLCTSCSHSYFDFQSGDLVFRVANRSQMSQAITDATSRGHQVEYDHVGIVSVEGDEVFVIEASAVKGVVKTPWNKFLQSSAKIESNPGVSVMRLTRPFDVEKTIIRAENNLGLLYDWSYRSDNGKLYCSELVYECYLDEEGKPLFTARPMNFRDADGNMPAFWIDLFKSLGESIPEGEPGTNPNDMSQEKILKEVYRFF